MNDWIKPDRLKKGDAIGIVSPARPCDPKLLLEAKLNFLKRGFRVIEAENLHESYGYLAGPDEVRAMALMKMFLNKDVKAIWCTSGGYGSSRLLDYLDFDQIRKNPKIFIGLSDITALHVAFNMRSKMVTLLGPTLSVFHGDIYKESAEDVEKKCFEYLLSDYKKHLEISKRDDFSIICEGFGEGRLLGGNLAIICSLVGTKYSLKLDNSVLLIEDVNEPPYKIDRMLNQLKQAKSLENLQGVILASFKNCEAKNTHSLSLRQVFEDYFSNAKYPVVYGIASGHIDHMMTLPLGSLVKLDTKSHSMQVEESYYSIKSLVL